MLPCVLALEFLGPTRPGFWVRLQALQSRPNFARLLQLSMPPLATGYKRGLLLAFQVRPFLVPSVDPFVNDGFNQSTTCSYIVWEKIHVLFPGVRRHGRIQKVMTSVVLIEFCDLWTWVSGPCFNRLKSSVSNLSTCGCPRPSREANKTRLPRVHAARRGHFVPKWVARGLRPCTTSIGSLAISLMLHLSIFGGDGTPVNGMPSLAAYCVGICPMEPKVPCDGAMVLSDNNRFSKMAPANSADRRRAALQHIACLFVCSFVCLCVCLFDCLNDSGVGIFDFFMILILVATVSQVCLVIALFMS